MIIQVRVKTGSKHTPGLEVQDDGSYVLYTRVQPIEGKANAAAIATIAEHYDVAKSAVTLLRGATSHYKTFEISK